MELRAPLSPALSEHKNKRQLAAVYGTMGGQE